MYVDGAKESRTTSLSGRKIDPAGTGHRNQSKITPTIDVIVDADEPVVALVSGNDAVEVAALRPPRAALGVEDRPREIGQDHGAITLTSAATITLSITRTWSISIALM